MTSLFKLIRRSAARQMDPLHVAMTGVRMGERVLQIGCDDRSLLAGLAMKVGLSGLTAVVVFDNGAADRARGIGAKVGALVDVRSASATALPFEPDHFDMIVVDDTGGAFAGLTSGDRLACLRDARRVLRRGGRIEVVEGLGRGGWFSGAPSRPTGYDTLRDLAAAGFKPVRALAEKDGFRFVEGLNTMEG